MADSAAQVKFPAPGGRGRGRGRGLALQSQPAKPGTIASQPPKPVVPDEKQAQPPTPVTVQSQPPKPAPPQETKSHSPAGVTANKTPPKQHNIEDLVEGLREDRFEKDSQAMIQMLADRPTTQMCSDLATLIVLRSIDEADFCSLAARLCDCLSKNSPTRAIEERKDNLFRNALLSAVASRFKLKATYLADNHNKFRGLCSLCCELFIYLRFPDGRNIDLLGLKSLELLKDLLEKVSSNPDEIDSANLLCFHEEFLSCGKFMQACCKDGFTELCDKMRGFVLNQDTSRALRCVLMELLEVKAGNWKKDLVLSRFYSDMLDEVINSP